jgi:hypothetical protein
MLSSVVTVKPDFAGNMVGAAATKESVHVSLCP